MKGFQLPWWKVPNDKLHTSWIHVIISDILIFSLWCIYLDGFVLLQLPFLSLLVLISVILCFMGFLDFFPNISQMEMKEKSG